MAFNITTDVQNAKYSEEFQKDLEDFFALYQSELNDYLKENPDLTIGDIENFIAGLLDGNQVTTEQI